MTTNKYKSEEAEEYVAKIDAAIDAYLETRQAQESAGLVGPFDGTRHKGRDRKNPEQDR